MARITIQVLEGFERGRVFGDLSTPITIGREEDNTIQLNDERVSRFHVKIQEDSGRVILTDLDSTNGTRINGHPVQMRVLQFGDQMSIGRSLLLYGSPGEIDGQMPVENNIEKPAVESPDPRVTRQTVTASEEGFNLVDRAAESSNASDEVGELFPNGPPELPADLRMAQMAQLSDVLAYVHDQLALVLDSAVEDRRGNISHMQVDRDRWQQLLKVEMQLASYLRQIADPRT
ncbi:MAG TPA: FHA domain-containing protein [Planctomycetaceae bacterium]|jgi:pSer/pThr/pTyr-binding forkhead associated (FHA) protein